MEKGEFTVEGAWWAASIFLSAGKGVGEPLAVVSFVAFSDHPATLGRIRYRIHGGRPTNC